MYLAVIKAEAASTDFRALSALLPVAGIPSTSPDTMSIAISLRAQHNGPSGVPTSFRFCGGDTAGGGKLTAVGTGTEGGGADASVLDGGAAVISTVETLPQELRNIASKVRADRIFMLEIVTAGSTFDWGFDCTSTPVVEPNSLFKVVALRVSTVVFLRAAMQVALCGGRLNVAPLPKALSGGEQPSKYWIGGADHNLHKPGPDCSTP